MKSRTLKLRICADRYRYEKEDLPRGKHMPVPQPNPEHQRASDLFEAKDWKALEFEARRLVSVNGSDGIARSFLGVALSSNASTPQEHKDAISEHVKATMLASVDPMTWNNYTTALLLVSRYEDPGDTNCVMAPVPWTA